MGTPLFSRSHRLRRSVALTALLCGLATGAHAAGSPPASTAAERSAGATIGIAQGVAAPAGAAARSRQAGHRPRARKAGRRQRSSRGRRSLGRAVPLTPRRAPAGLLFEGDEISDFALNQSAPGAVAPVPDPAGAGSAAMQMTVTENDVAPVTPTSNPRAQLLSPSIIDPGEEVWWSARFYLPSEFPDSTPGWVTLMEGPYGAPFDGPPPFHIEVSGDELRWQRNSTYDWDVPWSASLVRGRWVEIVLHQRFASDGFVEMWVDGQPVTFFADGSHNPAGVPPTQRLPMQTLDASNGGGANFVAIQNYREAGMFDSVTVLHGPLRIGTSHAAVAG